MGLDMYAYSTKNKINGINFDSPEDAVEIKYWRKFNNLHGWMQKLYMKKGGDEYFNCVNLHLTIKDIEDLEKDAKELEPISGFFFGSQSEMEPEDVKNVLEFCKECRFLMEDGLSIYYTSWW